MLEDKPTRWQQVVLAERYNGRRQGERREREGFIWVFFSSLSELNSELPLLKRDLLVEFSMCVGQRKPQRWQRPIKIFAAFLTYIWTLQDYWLMRWETFTTVNVLYGTVHPKMKILSSFIDWHSFFSWTQKEMICKITQATNIWQGLSKKYLLCYISSRP